ncbi:MAG: DUF1232 domain-containing protein [Clostridiales bacterium]|nr:DUF1232 domain-containing protein [Clostridiales bacterium]
MIKLDYLKNKAATLKKEVVTLYIAYTRKGTPIYAKAVIGVVLAYALSPIDLIPDFIPIIGYLDDLLLIPLGIMLAIKLLPDHILEECRREAEIRVTMKLPSVKWMIPIVVMTWIFIAISIFRMLVT